MRVMTSIQEEGSGYFRHCRLGDESVSDSGSIERRAKSVEGID